MSSNILASLVLMLIALPIQAEILFEAFYRVERRGQHDGYVIQRVAKENNQKIITTYIRTRQYDREVHISSKSVASEGKGLGVETIHNSTTTGAPFKIQSEFAKDASGGVVRFFSNKARKARLVQKIAGTPTPSAFLFFQSDFTKMKSGVDYRYNAFFEESGETQVGTLSMLNTKEFAKAKILQVLHDDSAQPVENFLSPSGEALGSRSLATSTVVYWVPSKEEAVGTLSFPTAEISALFGDLPAGQKNPWRASKLRAYDVIQTFAPWDGRSSLATRPVRSEAVAMMPERPL